jgi:predicted nucleic acid-binding protein
VILVDSSVWISQLRGKETEATRKLRSFAALELVLVGDLILLEVLQGARDEEHAARLERALRSYVVVRLLNDDLACRAARHHSRLRTLGITVRKTVDLVIGTFCIEGGHSLLHEDRDFDPMAAHLGLKVV